MKRSSKLLVPPTKAHSADEPDHSIPIPYSILPTRVSSNPLWFPVRKSPLSSKSSSSASPSENGSSSSSGYAAWFSSVSPSSSSSSSSSSSPSTTYPCSLMQAQTGGAVSPLRERQWAMKSASTWRKRSVRRQQGQVRRASSHSAMQRQWNSWEHCMRNTASPSRMPSRQIAHSRCSPTCTRRTGFMCARRTEGFGTIPRKPHSRHPVSQHATISASSPAPKHSRQLIESGFLVGSSRWMVRPCCSGQNSQGTVELKVGCVEAVTRGQAPPARSWRRWRVLQCEQRVAQSSSSVWSVRQQAQALATVEKIMGGGRRQSSGLYSRRTHLYISEKSQMCMRGVWVLGEGSPAVAHPSCIIIKCAKLKNNHSSSLDLPCYGTAGGRGRFGGRAVANSLVS